MSRRLAAALALAAACGGATAQGKGFIVDDFSNAQLMDKRGAGEIWKAGLPEGRLSKLYPPVKYGFLSQVDGGLDAGQCVVTARVALLPRTSPTRRLVWEPVKTATTYGAKAATDAASCRAFASEKLKEAVGALVGSLVKT